MKHTRRGTQWGLDAAEETRTDWRLDAACRGHDPEWWSLTAMRGEAYKAAHRICHRCPVKARCEQFAIETASWGMIFGGRDFSTPTQRAVIYMKACENGNCRRLFPQLVSHGRFCSKACRDAHYSRIKTRKLAVM